MTGIPSGFGRDLCKEWGVSARGYFDKNGSWYMWPGSYPAAFCDPNGYVLFSSEDELKKCAAIRRGIRVHVSGGISSLPNYKKMH